jgi:hypothetical protein
MINLWDENAPNSGRREENIVVRTSKMAALGWTTDVSDVAKDPVLDTSLYKRNKNRRYHLH